MVKKAYNDIKEVRTIQNKLKEIRMKKYMMKQKEFSELLGIKNASYHVWETGSSKPNIEVALEIAKKLNMKIEEIWYLE